MKVLLYSQNQKQMKKSGIGHALNLQKTALEKNGIEVTFDPRDSYDLCHINTLFYRSYRFMRTLQKKKIPVITHAHSTKEDFLNSFRFSNQISGWFNHNLLRMYRHATTIITPTLYSKRLIENYGIQAPIYAVSNGIDLEKYLKETTSYTDQEEQQFYDFIGIRKDDPFIIGMGFYFVRKGIVDFIEVARQFPHIKFIWFGHRYKAITSSLVMKSIRNKPDNVILPGYIHMGYKKIAFAKAKAFFFPSYEETEGIVTLEALASKLPLLVRDIGVYEGWLKKDVHCHMGRNNQEFVAEINKILNEDQISLIENGYQVVLERDSAKIGAQLKAIYKKVLQEQKEITE